MPPRSLQNKDGTFSVPKLVLLCTFIALMPTLVDFVKWTGHALEGPSQQVKDEQDIKDIKSAVSDIQFKLGLHGQQLGYIQDAVNRLGEQLSGTASISNQKNDSALKSR